MTGAPTKPRQVCAPAPADDESRLMWQVAGALASATGGDDVPLTVSAGVASAAPALDAGEDLLLDADRALYEAKAAGRRRVAVSGSGVSLAVAEEGGAAAAERRRTPALMR